MTKYSRKGKVPRGRPYAQQEDDKERSTAEAALEALIGSGFRPDRLDQLNDTFRLLGVVMGNLALLRVVTDPHADEKAVVSAARALIAVKEDPETIAERLRASSLSGLSVEQLQAIISKMEGSNLHDIDLQSLIQSAKEAQDAP